MSVIDAARLGRMKSFSLRTFGPGSRTNGVLNHIEKEIEEVRAKPDDLGEWVDIIILGFDGAWRSDHNRSVQEIIDAVIDKWDRNEKRVWPDWRTADPDKAIEHDRSYD